MCIASSYSTIQGATSPTDCVPQVQSTSDQSQLSNNATRYFVQIFEFTTSYDFAEMTDVVRGKMQLAISNMLKISQDFVVLVIYRVQDDKKGRQMLQTSFLVKVGLIGYTGSLSNLVSRITEQNLISELLALGLNSIRLVFMSKSTPSDPIRGDISFTFIVLI